MDQEIVKQKIAEWLQPLLEEKTSLPGRCAHFDGAQN